MCLAFRMLPFFFCCLCRVVRFVSSILFLIRTQRPSRDIARNPYTRSYSHSVGRFGRYRRAFANDFCESNNCWLTNSILCASLKMNWLQLESSLDGNWVSELLANRSKWTKWTDRSIRSHAPSAIRKVDLNEKCKQTKWIVCRCCVLIRLQNDSQFVCFQSENYGFQNQFFKCLSCLLRLFCVFFAWIRKFCEAKNVLCNLCARSTIGNRYRCRRRRCVHCVFRLAMRMCDCERFVVRIFDSDTVICKYWWWQQLSVFNWLMRCHSATIRFFAKCQRNLLDSSKLWESRGLTWQWIWKSISKTGIASNVCVVE